MRRTVLVLALVLAAVLVPAPPSTAAPDEVRLISEERLSDRLTGLTLFSPALQRTTDVRVLLPRDHQRSDRPLPVLWLLHGGFDDFRSWTDKGAAEALTDGLDIVVVMPDAGPAGWYADWKRGPEAQRQRWETWHLTQLRPWIEHRYDTRRDRDGRAVAGLSMGGFGTMHAATRHPDLFGFAAAFSGALDILHPPVSALVEAGPLFMAGAPGDTFGDRIAEETSWRAHNPVDLAPNLRHTEVQVRTGTGDPGGRHGGGPDLIEAGLYRASTNFHHRLNELGIDHVWEDRPGAHQWPYWQDDLANTLPAVMAHFERPPHPPPAEVEHVAFEPAFSVWGHDVALDRPVLETTVLTVRPDGFALRGTGSGTVTTDARFRRGQHVVVEHDVGGSRTTTELIADAAGRLQVPVDLGPASLVDEYPAGGLAAAPRTVEVRVLERAAGRHTPDAAASAVTSEPTVATPAPTLPATGGRVAASTFVSLVVAVAGIRAALRRGRRRAVA